MKKEFIAHRREKDGEPQHLCDHLTQVSVLCGQFAEKIGLKEAGRLIGLFHDFGKASDEFQRYIESATGRIDPDSDDYIDPKEKKGKIDHSSAGAQAIFRELSSKGPEGTITAQLLSLCIASHHSGLIDCLLPDGRDDFSRRMRKTEEKTRTDEALSYLSDDEKQNLKKLLSSSELVTEVIQKLKSLKEANDHQDTAAFKCGLLVRYLFSCLIDADRLNTADFEFPSNTSLRNYGEYHPWQALIERLDNKLKSFKRKNMVDDVRKEVSQQCLEYSNKPKGLYQLTVPTGGGKTLASLRFALHHAAKHEMDRIFYVIPYTSIIDQNAEEVRKILEDKDKDGKYLDKVVLEHHSNLTPEEESRRQSLLSQNWDAPVVFTTQVQFLETLFGSGTRGARRMHQLANSVIIFDEVQTIPVRCVHMFNVALRFLVHSCGSTAVLCTATQPLLDKIEPAQRSLTIPPEHRMMQNEKELFAKLKRVKVQDRRRPGGWSQEDVRDLAVEELKKSGSVLIIVNRKDSAQSLSRQLKDAGTFDTYHLSTNMCPAHRLGVLNTVKARLDNSQPVVCVSTQLIEAGVDIDFGSVIRYLAGLDSIAQAAGRCNRNKLRKKLGNVYIVNPAEENLQMLKDIRLGVEKAERVLDEFKDKPSTFGGDLLNPAAMEQYYKYYFYDRQKEMDYPVTSKSPVGRDDHLFDLLATNPVSFQEYLRVNENSKPALHFRQSFQTAAKAFRVIDSPTRGVIVPYGHEGEKVINNLCGAEMLEKQYKLLKAAQRFSVNLYSHELEDMGRKNAIHEIQKDLGIYYMDYQYYSDEFGWSEEVVREMKPLCL